MWTLFEPLEPNADNTAQTGGDVAFAAQIKRPTPSSAPISCGAFERTDDVWPAGNRNAGLCRCPINPDVLNV